MVQISCVVLLFIELATLHSQVQNLQDLGGRLCKFNAREAWVEGPKQLAQTSSTFIMILKESNFYNVYLKLTSSGLEICICISNTSSSSVQKFIYGISCKAYKKMGKV